MKELLRVKKRLSQTTVICEDDLGRTKKVYTTLNVTAGNVLIISGDVVIGRANQGVPQVYEV